MRQVETIEAGTEVSSTPGGNLVLIFHVEYCFLLRLLLVSCLLLLVSCRSSFQGGLIFLVECYFLLDGSIAPSSQHHTNRDNLSTSLVFAPFLFPPKAKQFLLLNPFDHRSFRAPREFTPKHTSICDQYSDKRKATVKLTSPSGARLTRKHVQPSQTILQNWRRFFFASAAPSESLSGTPSCAQARHRVLLLVLYRMRYLVPNPALCRVRLRVCHLVPNPALPASEQVRRLAPSRLLTRRVPFKLA